MDILRIVLLVLHILGLAAILGGFFFQLRKPGGFDFGLMLGGAITQLVTGAALVGVRYGLGLEVDNTKIAIKLGVAVLVLLAVIGAIVAQRRGAAKAVKPFFHTAGALALINVIVAVAWQ